MRSLVSSACGSSRAPKEEAERLMNAGMPLARQVLAENREFHPFAFVMAPTGEVRRMPHDESSLVEHRDGYCANAFPPYTRAADGSVAFGTFFAAPRPGAIFAGCNE